LSGGQIHICRISVYNITVDKVLKNGQGETYDEKIFLF